MEHLRTKTDLINLAETKLPKEHTSIARAFHEGTVENLGAFAYIAHGSGWVIKVTSKFKKIYYLAIVAGQFNYEVVVRDYVPWQYWEGDKSDNKLYQGDNPKLYKELRDDSKTTGLNKDAGHTCPDS